MYHWCWCWCWCWSDSEDPSTSWECSRHKSQEQRLVLPGRTWQLMKESMTLPKQEQYRGQLHLYNSYDKQQNTCTFKNQCLLNTQHTFPQALRPVSTPPYVIQACSYHRTINVVAFLANVNCLRARSESSELHTTSINGNGGTHHCTHTTGTGTQISYIATYAITYAGLMKISGMRPYLVIQNNVESLRST